MRKIRSVYAFRYGIFDLDGTLADTMADCGRIFAELTVPYGASREDAHEFYYQTTGSPMREQFREILRRHGHRPKQDELDALWEEFGRRFGITPTTLFPEVPRLLYRLRAAGVRLYVSSASPDATVRKRLRDGAIGGRFELAFGSTAVLKGRAHVERFAANEGLEVADLANNAFFCGDGEADMRIAKAVGAHAIGVLGTVDGTRLLAAGAERIVRSVAELISDP